MMRQDVAVRETVSKKILNRLFGPVCCVRPKIGTSLSAELQRIAHPAVSTDVENDLLTTFCFYHKWCTAVRIRAQQTKC